MDAVPGREMLAMHVQKCTHLMASRGRTWDHAKHDAYHGEQQHYGRRQDVGKIALRHHKESEGMKSLGESCNKTLNRSESKLICIANRCVEINGNARLQGQIDGATHQDAIHP